MSYVEKYRIREIINTLIEAIDEEDIGISLCATQYQLDDELVYFKQEEKKRVVEILNRLVSDSERHKEIIKEIINALGDKFDAN